ncbi:MAG TPA: NAD(+) diphosphatase [Lichenihabitans sp.]|jgi:NAD+ diphosphatase|nr:NAD(+) diphosphatase [Lichenihabitans sp.]
MTPEAFARTSSFLGFAHNALDRLANFRDEASFLDRQRQEPAARSMVVVGDGVVLREAPGGVGPWLGLDDVAALGEVEEAVFLGRDAAGPVFATLVGGTTGEALASRRPELSVGNLRAIAVDGSVSGPDLGALAEGKALLNWHARHRFCPNCGAPSRLAGAGWRRECPACGTHHFPRTDPVVIMLAIDGDRCLMGRQPRFPPSMYSCLAGFVEPGETIEAAVAREIAEESGIAVGRITYLGSQPWPFPSSLMIGCLAQATSTAITIDRQELEDARWFTRGEVTSMLSGTHPEGLLCPTPMAIAHHIVRAWVEGREGPA